MRGTRAAFHANAPTDPSTMAFIRIVAGLLVVYIHLCYTYDLHSFFGKSAWYDLETANRERWEAPTRSPSLDWEWNDRIKSAVLPEEPHRRNAVMGWLRALPQDKAELRKKLRLLDARGEESTNLSRFAGMFVANNIGHDRKFAGWPWLPGTTSWIEPTSHALVALKRAAPRIPSRELRRRVTLAEGMILRRRCADGGWNYGSRAALGVDLPSYPETTALALLGLQSCGEADLSQDLIRAQELWRQCRARLGRAWLAISLRNFGINLPEDDRELAKNDILATALEALSSPNGGHALLRPEARV